jgi:hypothetical protein
MRNVWKGLVIGAVTGAVAGAGLDRRHGRNGPVLDVSTVTDRVPSGAQIHDGLSDAADKLRQFEVPTSVSDAADAVRHKVGQATDSETAHAVSDAVRHKVGQATDSETAHAVSDAVRAGVSKAAAGTGEFVDAVRDRAAQAASDGREKVATARSAVAG